MINKIERPDLTACVDHLAQNVKIQSCGNKVRAMIMDECSEWVPVEMNSDEDFFFDAEMRASTQVAISLGNAAKRHE